MRRCALLIKRPYAELRRCSTKLQQHALGNAKEGDALLIRNIGILAHIDAGKTTTTERMLFYSGSIRNMGEVHHGNTVTDYMAQERLRGITITSAAVTFQWNKHRFNLIDTPGHIDFTMEVEQTLSVLDGAIVVLDGSAGVEAQTVTVWRQADRYGIPRIVYVNKMDRRDADVNLSLRTLQSKLQVKPLCVHLPVYEGDNDEFAGVVDLLSMEKLIWDPKDRGKSLRRTLLEAASDGSMWEDAMRARGRLAEDLADVDDAMAEQIIQQESVDSVPAELLRTCLRRATLQQKGVAVLCGSSYKNRGVQTLMDAVIHYLPAPTDRDEPLFRSFRQDLCARAFKVIHDSQKRPITFFRIFSGKMKKGQKLFNINQKKTEQTARLMVAYADENEDVDELSTGNIAAVTGLKDTVTGDLVAATATSATHARDALKGLLKDEEVNALFEKSAAVPQPVFFCSVEPPSAARQSDLEEALSELQREDPSLKVTYNGETGQTILGGMGELHLDIIKNRILSEYKIDVELGPLQIAYKEFLQAHATVTHVLQQKVGSSQHNVKITLSASPSNEKQDDITILLDHHPDNAANTSAISPRNLAAVKAGVEMGLAHGPKISCPVADVRLMLHWLEVGRGTSVTMLSAAAAQCVQKLLEDAGTVLQEPVMQLEVVTSEETLSVVLADLSRRRTAVQQVSVRGDSKVVRALTPLAEMLGYSTDLRTITSGIAVFTMEFHAYQTMSQQDEMKAVEDVTGFSSTG